MSKLSQLVDRISGRRRAPEPDTTSTGGLNADSPDAGGRPYPNAATVDDNNAGE